jgi:hypothetical protein
MATETSLSIEEAFRQSQLANPYVNVAPSLNTGDPVPAISSEGTGAISNAIGTGIEAGVSYGAGALAPAAASGPATAIGGALLNTAPGALAPAVVTTEALPALAAAPSVAAPAFAAPAVASPLTIGSTVAAGIAALGMGLFGMPESHKQSMQQELASGGYVSDETKEAIKKNNDAITAKYGFDNYQEYLDSKTPPRTPFDDDVQALKQSGAGDIDYEMDQLEQQYKSGYGKQLMENYWKANPKFFTPTGERVYQYQEDVDAANYFASIGKMPALTNEQKATMAANGLDPNGMLDIQAEAAKYPQTTVRRDPATGEKLLTVAGDPYLAQGGAPTGSQTVTPPAGTPTPSTVTDPSPTPVTPTVPAPPAGSNPILPPGTAFQFTPQQMAANEFMTPQGKLLAEAAYASNDNMALQAAYSAELGIPNVSQVSNSLPTLEEIMAGMPDDAIMADVQSELSARYLAAEASAQQTLADFQAFAGSTVREQFAMLQDDWTGAGGENKIPFYARGPVTAAKQALEARGMGGSSMAAAAITQAGLESMMPMAMADAQFMQTLSIKSFDQQSAIGIAKLSHIANLDMADLNYQQQKAVDTANKFFQINMSNVDNERAVALTNNANRMQALFTDQAAMNVATNLGFTTQAQQDQFYDQLSLQAQEATARLLLSNNQFNASVENSRLEFNATMSAEIERDNIAYLRSINTANTAGENQANMINSQNLLGISNTAIANALTLERDQLNRIFEGSENMASRMNNYAIAKLQADAALGRLVSQQDHESSAAIGGFLSSIGTTLFNGVAGKIFNGKSSSTSDAEKAWLATGSTSI